MYGTRVNEGLDLLGPNTPIDLMRNRLEYRREIIEALDFAAMKMKVYYD
jgi:hypothetical protein